LHLHLPFSRNESRSDEHENQATGTLTEDAYPLLWRGLVESNASMQGHLWYSLTAAGLELAQERARAGKAQDWPPPEPAEGDEAAFDFYLAARLAEVAALEAGSPKDKNEIGEIPMPVCPELRKCEGCAAPCADGPEYKCPKDGIGAASPDAAIGEP
jgi:hypothetical protein